MKAQIINFKEAQLRLTDEMRQNFREERRQRQAEKVRKLEQLLLQEKENKAFAERVRRVIDISQELTLILMKLPTNYLT